MKLQGVRVKNCESEKRIQKQEKGEWVLRPAKLESASSYALGWKSKGGADFEKVSGKCKPKCVCNSDNYCLCVSHREPYCYGDMPDRG